MFANTIPLDFTKNNFFCPYYNVQCVEKARILISLEKYFATIRRERMHLISRKSHKVPYLKYFCEINFFAKIS